MKLRICFRLISFLLFFLFAGGLSFGIRPPSAWAVDDPLYPQGKRAGYMGDPSHKRGIELGYDLGLKAGTHDKSQQQKADVRSQKDFQNPEKHYRYEYGSQAAFISGFVSGFAGGYRQGYANGMPGFQPASLTVIPLASSSAPSALPAMTHVPGEGFSAVPSSSQVIEAIKNVKKTKRVTTKSDSGGAKTSEHTLRLDAL